MKPDPNEIIDPNIPIVPIPEAEKVITVKTVCHCGIHGRRVKPGVVVKITIQQWRACSRNYLWIDGPISHRPNNWQPADSHTAPAAQSAPAAAS
jgi:hypothetical protein